MVDYSLEMLLIEQDNEYLRENWRSILENNIVYINNKEIKRILLEEMSSDWGLFFTFYKHKDSIDIVVKLLVEDLRKNGIRYVSKYIIIDLFKKMLKEYDLFSYVRKNRHRLYTMKKRQRIENELKILYIKQ